MRNSIWLIGLLILVFGIGCKKNSDICNLPTPLIVQDSVLGNVAFLSWTNTSPNPSAYQLEYRSADSVNWQTYTAYNNAAVISLLPNTNYIWKVANQCGQFTSSYSNTTTFHTANIIGTCNFDSAFIFNATGIIASPANKSLMVYAGDTSTYVSFVFSTYPTSLSTYLIVSPGSSASGNTAVMTARFAGGVTNVSTGTDNTSATVTVINGKISLTVPKVTVANVQTSDSSGVFTNIIINQP